MKPQFKFTSVTPPAAIVDNASLTTASIDTKGFSYAAVVVYLGATDIALTALKLQESDTDGSFADIPGLDFTGALPSATDDNKAYGFLFPLKGRKRYLDLVATVGNGSAGGYATAFALLFQGEIEGMTASELGLGGVKILPTA